MYQYVWLDGENAKEENLLVYCSFAGWLFDINVISLCYWIVQCLTILFRNLCSQRLQKVTVWEGIHLAGSSLSSGIPFTQLLNMTWYRQKISVIDDCTSINLPYVSHRKCSGLHQIVALFSTRQGNCKFISLLPLCLLNRCVESFYHWQLFAIRCKQLKMSLILR